ncbi:hypothetical protein FisN_7Lh329 [Fistulifera solaris]|uniref:Right handed beta helix domain-containing protein n=1 Tax=Fistulifera solaris TaxID=1519565 RepID=A0A1Z5JRF5_FISSO|nr:hypothetical protein FisN_7Lh329 [Fistulifera solaris]|eukprot:GAX16597.1 hypothetical protein FisN_7Lh329 [Fistulifera solaris]
MSFMGLSFADFEGNTDLTGASIGAYASALLTATFSDVAFTDFESDFVVRQTAGFSTEPPMNIEMRDVTVTGGTAGVLFDNDGGVFRLEGASVTDVTSAALIATANSGSSFLQDSSVLESSLNSVTFTTATGSTSVINTKVTDMVLVDDAFYVEGDGSSLSMSDVEVSGTQVNAPLSWTAVAVQSQATATLEKVTIAGNEGLEFGLGATLGGVISMKDSVIENNQGVQPLNRTSAPLFGISDSEITVERSQFTGNEGFTAVGVFLLRSNIILSTSCIQNGSSEFVISVDSTSTFTMDTNFLENYQSEQCDIGARLFKETDGSGCFVGSGTCEGTCEVLADQTECRIEALEPTASPTATAPVATTVSPSPRPSSELTQQPTMAPLVERTLLPSTDAPTFISTVSDEPTFMGSDELSSVPTEIILTSPPSIEMEEEEISGKSKKSSKKGKKESKGSKSGKSSHSGKGSASGKGSKSGKKSKSGKGGKGSEGKHTKLPALAVTMSPTGLPSSSPSTTVEQERSANLGFTRQVVGRRQWRKFLQDVAQRDESSS